LVSGILASCISHAAQNNSELLLVDKLAFVLFEACAQFSAGHGLEMRGSVSMQQVVKLYNSFSQRTAKAIIGKKYLCNITFKMNVSFSSLLL